MIPLVVYAEAGGTYKTTYAANLSVAFSRLGLDVLTFDFDAQMGNLTRLFDVAEKSDDEEADNIVRHLLEEPKGEFEELVVKTGEGFDLVPAHGMLSKFQDNLKQKIEMETSESEMSPDEYPEHELFYRLLWDREQLQKEYDVVIVDPNARAEKLLYNAIFALRTILSPVQPTGKGKLSVDGVGQITNRMGDAFDIDIGLAALVPTGATQTKTHQTMIEQLKKHNPVPVEISKREAMMDEMWDARGSAFKVVEERWDKRSSSDESQPGVRRFREREVITLCKLCKLAAFVASEQFTKSIDTTVEFDVDGREKYRYETTMPPEQVSISQLEVSNND